MSTELTSGILLLDKSAGLTSAKAIAGIKRRLPNVRKIGHAGTLDPDATGLLVCLINSATRLASYAEKGTKVYSGTITLGISTSTDDMSGDELSSSHSIPTFESVRSAVPAFIGKISQRPPRVSAVKVNGKRAYALVREGVEVELREREVEVFRFEVSPTVDEQIIAFEVECSRGTYIRSLARDLGETLECGGALNTLRRTASFPFDVKDAVLAEEATAESISWESLFPASRGIELDMHDAERLRNGDTRILLDHMKFLKEGAVKDTSSSRVICREASTGRACSLLVCEEGQWKIAANAL